MSASSYKGQSMFETLEGRRLMSTVAYADFNNDGRVDMAAITSPTTVTVSLANSDGSYSVSATLTTPKNRPVTEVNVGDFNSDGKPDVIAFGFINNGFYRHTWLGTGNGTFGSITTEVVRNKPWHGGFF
jgi:hypothetical protein